MQTPTSLYTRIKLQPWSLNVMVSEAWVFETSSSGWTLRFTDEEIEAHKSEGVQLWLPNSVPFSLCHRNRFLFLFLFFFSPFKFGVRINFHEDFITIPFLVSTSVPSLEENLPHPADCQSGGLTWPHHESTQGEPRVQASLLCLRVVIGKVKKTGTEFSQMEERSWRTEQKKQVFLDAYHEPGKLLGVFTYVTLFKLHSHLLEHSNNSMPYFHRYES